MDSWKRGDDNDNLIFKDLEVLTSDDDDVDEILLVDINDCGIEMLWLNETVFIVLRSKLLCSVSNDVRKIKVPKDIEWENAVDCPAGKILVK